MKVGGNESATKYFKSNGGSTALQSKDPKTKYDNAVVSSYKIQIKQRNAADLLA
jgi:ADP-ribosylation factor GTPase-activating protein 2/3